MKLRHVSAKLTTFAVALTCLLASAPAAAHWCSNIWSAPARLVVKPEKSTVYLQSGQPTKLRVYLQNNFPYTLFQVKMRGSASGYSITVSPGSQTVQPGQNAGFLFTITKSGSSGTVAVTSLNLQVNFRGSQYPSGWKGSSDIRINQNPSQSLLKSRSDYDGSYQEASLTAATLAQKYPSTVLGSGKPFFGRTGLQQVIHWFGYRFCYSSSGGWRCGGQNCPSPCAQGSAWNAYSQFPQNCIRAGAEVAAFHARGKLGSQLTIARNAAVNALKGGGHAMHKCMAAVVGGYLFQGASYSTFTSALNSGSNGVPSGCRNAAMRILTGSSSSSCTSGSYYERAACAAAEGLRSNDAVVKSVLVAKAGDGNSSDFGSSHEPGYQSLYSAYMLYIVTAHRMAKTGKVTYYPDAGAPVSGKLDGSTPIPDLPPTPVCGDGKRNGSEQCDGADLAGATCKTKGFIGGTLTCHGNCTFNTSGCYTCGDGIKHASEQCDGTQFGGKTCASYGYKSGTLTCYSNCTITTLNCNTCGDGKRTGTEQCDGADLAGATCKTKGFFKGTLTCNPNCTTNSAGCSNCGDGKVDPGEKCDSNNLAGQSCQSLGFTAGSLTCDSGCAFNTAKCTTVTCGNGKLDAKEQCDGALLGGKTCKSQGFAGGSIACNSNCSLNTSGCYKCGDGKLNTGEQCDGNNLGGQTCKSLGFDGGTLSCKADCTFQTGACTKNTCGNGKIEGIEQCDGAALGGKTCKGLGFDGGTLKCKADCTYDTDACTSKACGNGKIDGAEKCDGANLAGKTCKALGFTGGALSCKPNCSFDTSKCTSPPKPDGGSVADSSVTPDSGTPTPDMGTVEPPDEGCRIGSTPSRMPAVFVLLILGVLIWTRRKKE